MKQNKKLVRQKKENLGLTQEKMHKLLETKMITTNEHGQQNLFAKEPEMYVSQTDAERYALETYAEKAEKANSRWAMLGFVAAVISYALTGHLFFGVI